jgi:hypothetical protein
MKESRTKQSLRNQNVAALPNPAFVERDMQPALTVTLQLDLLPGILNAAPQFRNVLPQSLNTIVKRCLIHGFTFSLRHNPF